MASAKSHVPPFVDSLWRVVSEAPIEVGGWDTSGEKYIVKQRYEFQKHALKYFTCSWKTFIRQLHFYGFSKTDSRGITWSFSHPRFLQGRPDLLHGVTRKTLGKGKIGGSKGQVSQPAEVEHLKAEFAAYKRNAEAVLKETKEDMLAELIAVKRELSIMKKSMQVTNRSHGEEEQPVKRQRTWESSTAFTELNETEETKEEYELFENLDCSGIDGILQQFGEDMIVPRRFDPNIYGDMPEMWLVMNRKVNVGARFFASFLNSFVAAARSWYELHSEPVLSESIHRDYPLRKLQRMLHPAASKILGSSLSADELAHDLIVRMGLGKQHPGALQGITVFEYSVDGGPIKGLNANTFATFLTNLTLAVQKLVNDDVKSIGRMSCDLFDRIEPLFAPFTQKAVQLAHELFRKFLYDRATAHRLYHCKCNYA